MWLIIIIALLVIFIPKHGSYLDDENEKLIYADSDDDKKDSDEDVIGTSDLNKNTSKKKKDKKDKKDSKSDNQTEGQKDKHKSKPNPKKEDVNTSSSRTRATKSSDRPDVSAIKNPIKSSGIKETDKSIKDAEDIVDKIYREGTK